MINFHSLFHRFKFVVGYTIAAIVIIIALGVSGLRLLLTTANLYQAEVEQLAVSLLKQPVKIGRMDARLSGLIPTLIFHDVQLISKKTNKSLLSLSRIDVGLSVDDLIWSQKITPVKMTVIGMNVHVTRTVEGNIKIEGIDIANLSNIDNKESNDFLEHWFSQQTEIGLEDSFLVWKDEQNAGLTWVFDNINLLLKNTKDRHQILLSSNLPAILGKKINFAFDLEGEIINSSSWDAKVFVESKNLKLAPLQKYIKLPDYNLLAGSTDLKLWADWEDSQVKQLSGNIHLSDVTYIKGKRKKVSIKLISGIFDTNKDENNNWNVSIDRFNYSGNKNILTNSSFSLAFNLKNKKLNELFVKSDFIKLEALSEIVTANHLLKIESEKKIKLLNFHGVIKGFYMAIKNNELKQLQANFSEAGLNSWKGIPKLDLVSGDVNYSGQNGVINLYSKKSIIGFPNLFRGTFKLDEIDAKVIFSNNKEGLLFNIINLKTMNSEVAAESKALLWIPNDESSPYLDLQTYIARGDVSKISHFLPASIMDDSLVKWLDNGIISGTVQNSTIIFNGKLSEFPFDNTEGKFLVDVDASNVVINYQEHWPEITEAKINADFSGQGMSLFIASGKVAGNVLYNSSAIINSFSKAELELNIHSQGNTHNTLHYLINSPILSSAKETISAMRWSGDIVTAVKVNIPLNDAISAKKQTTYTGSAILKDTSVFMLKDKIDITNAEGEINFTEKSFSSKKLSAYILGEQSTVTVSSRNNNNIIYLSAKPRVDAKKILKIFSIPGAGKVSGLTDVNMKMSFPSKHLKRNTPSLILTSNLLGVKSRLPDQFYKEKMKKQKFRFETDFLGNDKIIMGVEFGDKASAIIELDQSKPNPSIDKGMISFSDKKATLPRKNILYVDGSINKITPSEWVKALDDPKEKRTQSSLSIPVIFNLNKLKIITRDNEKKKNKKIHKKSTSPKKLPAFEGIIKGLYFNKINLGRIDFKSSKTKKGLRLDELIVSSKNMKLFAHGDWSDTQGKQATNLNITLSSDNFGSMLTDLGYSSVIDRGTAKTVGTINWKGSPMQFSLYRLNGNIQLEIENGSIRGVDTGAGRLLGLFSLSSLPRKLIGDFKDASDKAFNFDSAKGEIVIENGDAYTDDFEINSAIATINISGRTGLVDQDYENTVEVVPDVGGGVAGITALLVNLPAGIGVWLLDKLTGEQFNDASAKHYEISGTWEKPEIEEILEEDL